MDTAFFETWRPRALAVLRIVTAYLFMAHGTAKLFGMPYQKMFEGLQLMSLPGLAGILEVFGGFLILIGLFTRPVAFVLCGFMAVAYFMAHHIGLRKVPFCTQLAFHFTEKTKVNVQLFIAMTVKWSCGCRSKSTG